MSLEPLCEAADAQGGRAAEFALGARAIFPAVVSVVPFGLLLGTLAGQKGLSALEFFLMCATVFAGSAQFVVVDIWTEAVAVWTLASVTLLINLRHILMGAAITPAMANWKGAKTFAALFFLADEIWALAMRRAAAGPLSPAYYFGLALPLYLAFLASATLGHLLGQSLGDPSRFGFDFAFTAIFLALLTGLWRGRVSALPWLTSAVAAVLVAKLVPGVWYILAGGLAGAAASALARGQTHDA